MIRLLAFSALDGAAYIEENNELFFTRLPCLEKTKLESGEIPLGVMSVALQTVNDQVFDDADQLAAFLRAAQCAEIEQNPRLTRNRELLEKARALLKSRNEASGAIVTELQKAELATAYASQPAPGPFVLQTTSVHLNLVIGKKYTHRDAGILTKTRQKLKKKKKGNTKIQTASVLLRPKKTSLSSRHKGL